MIGKTSTRVTWSVRTNAGAWDDCYDEPFKHKECSRHLWTRLRPAYYQVQYTYIMDTGNDHARQPKLHCTCTCTIIEEVSAMEKGSESQI